MGRIIAGSLSSRRIFTPSGNATRPTTDRVRESVFSQLASACGTADSTSDSQLCGLTFLDLYAGSGAVGLEAVSRGASTTWVEKNRSVAAVIERNKRELGVGGRVVVADVSAFLHGDSMPYSIIWLDPPYAVASDDIDRLIRIIDEREWLWEGGILLVERSARSPRVEFPENFLNNYSRHYGDTTVYMARKGR